MFTFHPAQEGGTPPATFCSVPGYENPTVKRRKKFPYCRRIGPVVDELVVAAKIEQAEDDAGEDDEDEDDEEELVADALPFPCKECKKSFKSQTWLTRHLKSAHNRTKASEPELGEHACEECPKRFKTTTWLLRHLKNEHEGRGVPVEEAWFECLDCRKLFKTARLLGYHSQRAHGKEEEEEDDEEEEDEDEEEEVGSLAEAEEGPEEVWPRNAPVAATTTTTTTTSTSTGSTQVICDVCGQRFTTSSHLTLHKRVHSGERPYECQVCQRTYKCLKSFNKHLKVEHLQEAMMTCIKCRSVFVNEELYTLHWNTQRGRHCKA